MDLYASMHRVLLAAGLQPPELILLVVVGVVSLTLLVSLLFFGRLFGLWMQGFLAAANVSFPSLVGMMLRRTPMKQVVHLQIMAVQAGLEITTAQIESALLQGADVERAVLAMIRARDIGQEMTWDEVIREDASERLKKKLYDE